MHVAESLDLPLQPPRVKVPEGGIDRRVPTFRDPFTDPPPLRRHGLSVPVRGSRLSSWAPGHLNDPSPLRLLN